MSFFWRKRSSDSSDPDESRERWRNSVGLKNFRSSLGGDENTTYGIKEWAAGENPNVEFARHPVPNPTASANDIKASSSFMD